MEQDEKKPAEEAPVSKKGLLDNKLVLFGIIIVLQLVMAIVLVEFVVTPKLKAVADYSPEIVQEGVQEGILVDLEEMVVTLNDRVETPGFLRINVNLEVTDQKIADKAAEKLPKLRDTVILILSGKTSQEMRSIQGKEIVKAEIFKKLQSILPTESLMGVYFSDLVIQ
ncbi:flagellar basal body-associated FliL family protein [bacterium]|jgi:flagellar FliL protein|nr:flagellar basal body-associated FliL family protein [bacterium]MBT7310748.1 flagellar basal body-associated FliL family protein [bacterium]